MEPLRSIEFERHYVIPGAITLDDGDVPHLAGKVFASPSPEATPLVFGDSKLACESQGPDSLYPRQRGSATSSL